jgi:hypothetical protein
MRLGGLGDVIEIRDGLARLRTNLAALERDGMSGRTVAVRVTRLRDMIGALEALLMRHQEGPADA